MTLKLGISEEGHNCEKLACSRLNSPQITGKMQFGGLQGSLCFQERDDSSLLLSSGSKQDLARQRLSAASQAGAESVSIGLNRAK